MANTTDIIDPGKTIDKVGGVSEISGKLSQLTSNLANDVVEWLMRFSVFEWFLIITCLVLLFVMVWLKSKVKKTMKQKFYLN